jgi:ElaB/YqjD/DUF883 family membrane-anchored ribosome-binding protein
MSNANTNRLCDDVRQVIHDAEELLRVTAGQAGEHISQARHQAEDSLRRAKEQLASMGAAVGASAREAAEKTDGYVRSNPWVAVGAGALVGLLAGLLIGRRRGGST